MQIPTALASALRSRLETCPRDQALVSLSYQFFLRWLKNFLGDDAVSTYSIRRGVFDQLRLRCNTIEEIQKVTLHFHADQLRWYLEAPLADELAIQTHATAWHL